MKYYFMFFCCTNFITDSNVYHGELLYEGQMISQHEDDLTAPHHITFDENAANSHILWIHTSTVTTIIVIVVSAGLNP